MLAAAMRSEEHTSELQSLTNLVCRLLLEKKNKNSHCEQSPAHKIIALRTHHAVRAPARLAVRKETGEVVQPGVWRHYLFFFNDTATTEIYTLSLHDALPI